MSHPTVWIDEALRAATPSGYGWLTDTHTMMLMKDPFVPNTATQQFVSDIVADELTAATYGRTVMTGQTVVVVSGPGVGTFGADDVAFGSVAAGETAVAAVLFRVVTNDADSPLLASYPILRVMDSTPVLVDGNAAGFIQAQLGTALSL